MLAQLAKGVGSSVSSEMEQSRVTNVKRKNGSDDGVSKLREEVKRLRQQLKQKGKGQSQKGKDPKGKGKRSNKGRQAMPAELIGLKAEWNGKRICFSYNMSSGCTNSANAEGCVKGLHICARCGGQHPQHSQMCPQR